MRSGALASVVDLYRETIRWAWLRDEVQETATREKVLYFVVLYGSWFVVMLGVGLALQAGGYASAAEGVWFFGIWFSAFMAAIDVAWEGLGYLLERRDERAGPRPEPDSRRELGRDLRPARDTWVGFVVTVVALVMLFLSYELVLALRTAVG